MRFIADAFEWDYPTIITMCFIADAFEWDYPTIITICVLLLMHLSGITQQL